MEEMRQALEAIIAKLDKLHGVISKQKYGEKPVEGEENEMEEGEESEEMEESEEKPESTWGTEAPEEDMEENGKKNPKIMAIEMLMAKNGKK